MMLSDNASSYGPGALLKQQQKGGTWRAVVYASRSQSATEQRYAQIEKEALATTWAAERFSDFLTGLEFCIKTNHKPLVPLLGNKNLDEFPPRIQHFRMRLMKYKYTMMHVPGKELVIADTLCRTPVKEESDTKLEEEVQAYVDCVLSDLPTTDKCLKEICAA